MKERLQKYESILKEYALKIIDDCTKTLEFTHDGVTEKIKLIYPSGDMKYQAFWVRDCAMICETGLVEPETMKTCIEFIATYGQNGEKTRYFQNGMYAQPWAVTDHIGFNCRPSFYPGTYSTDDNQGDGECGIIPPLCDAYYWITLVLQYVKQSGDASILKNEYAGVALLDRLDKAFHANPAREDTQLSYTTDEDFAIDWGFCDGIKKRGDLLFSSILRWRAANALAFFYGELGERSKVAAYEKIAATIKKNIPLTFYAKETGWLYSATEICRQHDVWGTAFAVENGLLPEEEERAACKALYEGYRDETAVHRGYVRHIRTCDDYSKTACWERASHIHAPYNYYQNGSWWGTPVGWYATALYKYDKESCFALLDDFIDFTEKHGGVIYEYFNYNLQGLQGANYGTSVLCYLSLHKLVESCRE